LEAYWLNLGSLILGLLAWILPVAFLMRNRKTSPGKQLMFSAVSIGACAVSLCLQILYSHHLVIIEDWSALMDTSHAVAWVSALLLAVTLFLNAAMLISYFRNKAVQQ
jgi:hypothetical protein